MNRGLKRSLSDFSRHPWLHLISISTITVALVILGGFFIVYRNLENVAEKTSPQTTGTVYLREGLHDAEVQAVKQRILALENIAAATFKSRDSVVRELKSFLGSTSMESLPGAELFPDVVEVQLKPEVGAAGISFLKSVLANFPEVSEVDFSEDWLDQYRKLRQVFGIFGIVLMISVIVGCSFIIANFMGMRHQSRKEEIDIVWLVGAHRNFILSPFLWEGMIEGVIGSVLALLVLIFLKVGVGAVLSMQWSSLLGVKEWLFLSGFQVVGLSVAGIAMALCGGITVFFRFHERVR